MQRPYNPIKPLSFYVPKAAGPVFRRFGFMRFEIIERWAEIIGPRYAQKTRPERISFPRQSKKNGTLWVAADSSTIVLLSHIQKEILDRLNMYFGYEAVSTLKFVNRPIDPIDPIDKKPTL